MPAKLFSSKEIMELKTNPYVVDVTERFVYFSAEFKQRFYEEYSEGKKLKKIMEGMQIDPNILGMTRIYGIRKHIIDEAKSGRGFSDFRDNPLRDKLLHMSPEDKIKQLEHELAYTRQELDFVKKIIAVNREAGQE